MRIRQLKPTWFLDKTLQTRCRAGTREFYIGLCMIADDAGWFEWDVTSVATQLYPFVGVAKRERDANLNAHLLTTLEPGAPHLIIHDCGHAEVPKMPQHQRISDSKKVRTDYDHHRSGRCPAHPRGFPRDAADPPPGKERDKERGTERNGTVGSAQAREDEPTQLHSPAALAAASAGGFIAYRPAPKPSVAGKRR